MIPLLSSQSRFQSQIMSRNQVRTPCCKVCKDAGKSVKEYESHWPKDRDGKTICPTLLSQECRYCHKLGHTTKYCEVLVADEKKRARAQYQSPVVAKKEEKKSSKLTGGSIYSAAFGSDDEEEVHEPKPTPPQKRAVKFESEITLTPNKFNKNDFPALAPAPVAATTSSMQSYAAVALMPPAEKKAPAPVVASGTRITIADLIPQQQPNAVSDYEEEWENKKPLFQATTRAPSRPWDESDDESDADDAAEYLAAIHDEDW